MKRDAEAHAADDKKRREVVDLKNKADQALIQTKRALEEHGGKITAEARGKIESAISALETAVKSDQKDPIERALNELNTASYELGKAVYEATKGQPGATTADPNATAGATASSATSGKKDDVIDAEFEVKDEKKS